MHDEEIGVIGGREIVYAKTFIIPKGETLEFSFSPTHPGPKSGVSYNRFELRVKVKLTDRPDQVITAEWTSTSQLTGGVTISLPSVTTGRVGAIMGRPMKIGDIMNKPLGFHAALSGAGDDHVVTLQFVVGGSYE
jgi:hypothetical protein